MSRTFKILTRTNIRKLGIGKKLQEQGIIFTKLTNGDGLYSICIRADGQRVHRTVGKESEGTTRQQAEEFMAKIKIEAKEERLNLPKGRKTLPTFKEIAGKYLERLESEASDKELRMKKSRLAYHLMPFFKSYHFSKISSFDIERYKKQRLNEPVQRNENRITSKGTVNRELAVLSHLFNKAVEWGWAEKTPCKVKKSKEEITKTLYLTAEQIERLLFVASKDFTPIIYPLLFLAIKTGMRKSELFTIKLENVDLERRVIYIPKAKAGARQQPITKTTAKMLREYINNSFLESIWLFPSLQAPTEHVKDIRGSFDRVLREAGLDNSGITLHTLRHTAVTHLVQAGIDLPTVQRISGHKTLSMVARYSHQNGEHIAEAMERFDERVG